MAEKYKLLDLFSGIGGFSLGLESTGAFETVAFCEIEDYPARVLNKHWPEVPNYEDVRSITKERLYADEIFPDAICGGFPCQDISVAGKGGGIDAQRSGLWSEYVRILGEIRPRVAFVENVKNLISGPSDNRGAWFGRVLADLAEIGYDAQWHCVPAAAIGAPHIRDRVWVICYPNEDCKSDVSLNDEAPVMQEDAANAICQRQQRQGRAGHPGNKEENEKGEADYAFHDCKWANEPGMGRVAHGIPNGMDRLKCTGNALVPLVAYLVGKIWLETGHRTPVDTV